MNDRTIKFWDKQAENYDFSELHLDSVYSKIVSKTKQFLDPGDKILDFGCATGSKTIEIAENVKFVHGVDISAEMINEANKKIRDGGFNNILFTQGEIFEGNIRSESFNKVVSFGVLHLLENNDKVVSRIHDILKPGGLFIASVICLHGEMNIRNKIDLKLNRILKNIGFKRIEPHLYFPSDVEALLTANGFNIIYSELFFQGITISFVVARRL